jgi:hypothetical protein
MRRSRGTRWLCLTLALGACEFGQTTVPKGDDRLVVHSVLNPSTSDQQIIVERTLTGRVDIFEGREFDPLDPVVTAGGVPVTGADVRIFGPNGTAARAQEMLGGTQQNPHPTGVYIIRNSLSGALDAIRILPGRTYRLEVRDQEGRLVKGTTTIPQPALASVLFTLQPFNRDRDTLHLQWPAAGGAKQYSLRLETPLGPFFIFTPETSFDLAGSLRNYLSEELGRAFVPGFDQDLIIGAVDANYFDYYRSGNDPFTGSGLITHLEGGLGFFGAYVPIMRNQIVVSATRRYPVEGRYLGTAPNGNTEIQVYVESQRGSLYALSGNVVNPQGKFGAIGLMDGNAISVAVLRSMNRSDTLFVMAGTVNGETLVFGGSVFHKVP